MALIEIEYGSLASSDTMNKNFEYLDNQIADVADSMTSQLAGVYSNIASVEATLTNTKEQLEESINDTADGITSIITESGLYVVTYINGTSWYREYFSDSEKKNRVWLEQGGRAASIPQDGTKTISFLKNFSNTNYYVSYENGFGTSGLSRGMGSVTNLTVSSFDVVNGNDATITAIWRACGK